MKKNFLIEQIIGKVKKRIVTERKTDKLSLYLSRQVITFFKKNKNLTINDIYFERGNDYATFDFVCKFIKKKNFEHPFSIDATGDMENIELIITYNPDEFPQSMNDLVAEVKETIEHELEHVEQQNFEDMEVKFKTKPKNDLEYFLSSVEIPAYVRGLIKRANTKKISLDDAMDEWYSENIKKFEKKSDWNKVKKSWKTYAEKMKEKGKVKKFV